MKLRNIVKGVLGSICGTSALRICVRRSALSSINVVYYHYVGSSNPHYEAFYKGCTLSRFAEDLRRLSHVFAFVLLNQVIADQPGEKTEGRPALAVTFDDGFDLLQNGVMEVLDRYDVKATTFVITSCVGNRNIMWRHCLSAIQSMVPNELWRKQYDKLAPRFGIRRIRTGETLLEAARQWDMAFKDEWAALLWVECKLPPVEDYLAERQPYFTENGLRKWIANGHSVGFHTHTHPFSSRLNRTDLHTEFIQPVIQLKQAFGINEVPLSYPFGDRLRPDLEHELFEKRVFSGFWGIRGFTKKGTSNDKLERIGVEGTHLGWSVFAPYILNCAWRS